ncbi:hypothetical protein ACWEV3_10335 [Saccharopolyspora sp. NPDC003752]
MGLRRRPKGAPEGETWRVGKLRAQIAEATRLRGLVRNPDLVAVEIERHRRRTLIGLWFFLALGLVFTTAGVQRFLAGGTTSADPLWWAAWTVEPMFAGLLIVLLNFEALILSHGIDLDHAWWSRLKRVLLAATLFMNVIPQLVPLVTNWEAFNPGSALVHAIIPVIVYGLAEVIPVIQARARQAVLNGYAEADRHQPDPEPAPPEPDSEPEPEPTPARAPTAPAAPEPLVAPEPPAAVRTVQRGPKLPPQVAQMIDNARAQALREGREFTAADVQAVVRLPDDIAAQVAGSTTNGHAVA